MTDETNHLTGPADEVRKALDAIDPTRGALLSMLIGLEGDLTERGWDQPPMLLSLMGSWLDEGHYVIAAKSIGQVPEIAVEYGGAGITAWLEHAATSLPLMVPESERRQVTAFVLTHEAWMVKVAPGDEVAMMAARQHRLDRRPDRIETRMLIAVDRDGASYEVARERDGNLSAFVHLVPPKEFSGQLTEAMRTLAAAL